MFARALRQALLIVAVSGMLGIISNALAPWGIPWIARPRVLAAAPDSLLLKANGLRRGSGPDSLPVPLSITLAQAKMLFDRGQAVFVDARPPYEYVEAHIPGALNIPWEEIEYYAAEVESLPRDSTIVVYCAGESCDLSIHLGDHLAELGFGHVRVFFGGWLEWTDAGYPVETH